MKFSSRHILLALLASMALSSFAPIVYATPSQDNGWLTVLPAGKALFLRKSGFITKKLIQNSGFEVSFKEPISPVVSVQMLTSHLALVTKEQNALKVGFFSKQSPAIELSSSSIALSGNSVFCFGTGEELVLSNAKKVFILSAGGAHDLSFDLTPRATMRSKPSCAMNHRSLAFGFNMGEWGSLITAVDVGTRKERVIWESKTENLSGAIIDGGERGFYARHDHMILNWLGDGPVKSYSVDQQILSLYPLNSGKVLTIAPNGDIFKTRIEALSEPLKKSSLQIAGSDLRQIVYCDGILLLGVNSKGELVSMDMNGHGEKVFRLADYQIDNLLESF